jgi:alpha/beta superfamily hydrolase
MNDRWENAGAWVGDDLRREVFFFASGGRQLYGSLYAARQPPAGGVALCNSWGFEGNQADQTIHRTALAAARAGGAGLVFHYPGFGDSEGDLGEATMASLVEATVDAVGEASRRLPGVDWTLAGLMFGAAVAALAAQPAGAERLLLVQPALRPSRYLARLERSARRAAIRAPARAGNAYGYPLPHRMLEAGAALDAEIEAVLSRFHGEGAIVRYAEPPLESPAVERFEQILLPGTWRFGARQKPELVRAIRGWLERAGLASAAERRVDAQPGGSR